MKIHLWWPTDRGGGGGTVACMWDFSSKCLGSNSGQIHKHCPFAVAGV